jgi:hypothetical protein
VGRYDRQGDLSIKKGGKHAVLGWVGRLELSACSGTAMTCPKARSNARGSQAEKERSRDRDLMT